GQGDGTQHPPEGVAVLQLELTALGPPQEGAAGRLDHVLRADAPPQPRRQMLVRQAVQRRAVLLPKFQGDPPVPLAQSPDQSLPAVGFIEHDPLPVRVRRACPRGQATARRTPNQSGATFETTNENWPLPCADSNSSAEGYDPSATNDA